MTSTTSPTSPPLTEEQIDAVKTRQQATWASGDFAVIGTTLQLVGELLCEAVDIDAGWHVLDVAAGNGNGALAAARRNADVTATDYVPEVLERAAARAVAEGVPLTTRVADAEALPYADRTFDAVLSIFGVMFAPRQERAAAELTRVCRPGGRIGLASWTPTSFVAEMFHTVARYVSPPLLPSAFRWGTETDVVAMLGTEVSAYSAVSREFVFRYRSGEEFVETFRNYYGPTNRAFAALEPEGQDALEHDLITLAYSWNRSTSGALAVPGEYLEIVASIR
jgi:ubiquinone/menaquinone biosynthesis C-methylase UbiE